MTDRIIAYRNSSEEYEDSLGWGLVDWVAGHVWKATKVGIAISILPFTIGTMVAPEGTNRLEKGAEYTEITHAFLWSSAGQALGTSLEVIVPPIAAWMDNGSQQDSW